MSDAYKKSKYPICGVAGACAALEKADGSKTPADGPDKETICYWLSLGSNQGDRRAHIEKAVVFLTGCGRLRRKSALYETSPLGMAATSLFYNMALSLESELAPRELLKAIKRHELSQGRDLAFPHHQPRPIDIDILLAGDMVIRTAELVVPHPRLTERGFVLVPLFEIAPKLVHPLEKVTMTRLLSRLRGREKIRRLE